MNVTTVMWFYARIDWSKHVLKSHIHSVLHTHTGETWQFDLDAWWMVNDPLTIYHVVVVFLSVEDYCTLGHVKVIEWNWMDFVTVQCAMKLSFDDRDGRNCNFISVDLNQNHFTCPHWNHYNLFLTSRAFACFILSLSDKLSVWHSRIKPWNLCLSNWNFHSVLKIPFTMNTVRFMLLMKGILVYCYFDPMGESKEHVVHLVIFTWIFESTNPMEEESKQPVRGSGSECVSEM